MAQVLDRRADGKEVVGSNTISAVSFIVDFFGSAFFSDVLRSFSYYDHGPLGMKPGVLMSKEKYLLLTS